MVGGHGEGRSKIIGKIMMGVEREEGAWRALKVKMKFVLDMGVDTRPMEGFILSPTLGTFRWMSGIGSMFSTSDMQPFPCALTDSLAKLCFKS